MTSNYSLISRSGFKLLAISYFGFTAVAAAVVPDAEDDDLTGSSVDQDVVSKITEVSLTANDAGDGKYIDSVSSSSNLNAAVSWSEDDSEVSYDPRGVAALIALPEGSSVEDTFTYSLAGTDGNSTSTATVTLQVDGVNDSPAISGISSVNLAVDDDDDTKTPFTGVSITDPDTGETVTVTVSVSNQNYGTFTNLNGFSLLQNGNYEFTGSVSDATTKVAGLRFVPAENIFKRDVSYPVTLTVSVDDGDAPAVSDTRNVTVTSINDTPTISVSNVSELNDNVSSAIFSSAVLTDPDYDESLTVSITFDEDKGSFPAAAGTFSGSGASRNLQLDSATLAVAQSTLRALVFTPTENISVVGETDTLSFALSVSDGKASGNDNMTVGVKSINDTPELSSPANDFLNLSSGQLAAPFPDVTLTDPDYEADDTTDNGGVTGGTTPKVAEYTVTLILEGSPTGTIISDFLDLDADSDEGEPGDTVYTYLGSRVEAQSAIQGAQFLSPDLAGDFVITLFVNDDNVDSNEVSVTARVSLPLPSMSGLVDGQEVSDKGLIFPFATAAFNNFGGSREVAIKLDDDSKGAFDILSGFTKDTDTLEYIFVGNSAEATDAIQNLRYRPTENIIVGDSADVQFAIEVRTVNAIPGSPSDTLSVKVTAVNDAPVILSDGPEHRINDDESTQPFADMEIADVDDAGEQLLNVEITLVGEDTETNAAKAGGGIIESLVSVAGVNFVEDGVSPSVTYKFSGSAAEVTSVLQGLKFTPDANRNAVGRQETVSFTVYVADLDGLEALDQETTVVVTSVNGAPQITGIPDLSAQPAPLPAVGNGVMNPFADLEVTDEENLTFTITLDNPDKGSLSEDVDGFTLADGVYSMTDKSDAEITAALQALVYTLDPDYDEFPDEQLGLTTFTLEAKDSTNTTTEVFTVFIRDRIVSHIVSSSADSGEGSLREAIALAGNGDTIVFNFPTEEFPVTIELASTLTVNKNLRIMGSGVDELCLSGGQSVALFNVTGAAHLAIEQLTLKDGAAASYGGAISLEDGSHLFARNCSFEGNTAGQFGGAIEAYESSIDVEQCLFYQNSVAGSTAKAGGAISLSTTLACNIRNCTFVENQQLNISGIGGGAVLALNTDVSKDVDVLIEHCTFKDNTDAAGNGSALLTANSGMTTQLRNNILADVEGLVLDVVGGGFAESLGGNIATDDTVTTYTLNNQQNVILLNHPTDQRELDPLLDSLADNFGATKTCALLSGSLAIDKAIVVADTSETVGADQRGFWRGESLADIGAHEVGAFKRININEIYVQGGVSTDFIEFYNPRDSQALDLAGLQLFIDGEYVQTFTTQSVDVGSGYVWYSTVDLDSETGTIELKNAADQSVLFVSYCASFTVNGEDEDVSGQSITRYPRYEGGFLPHQFVVENVTGTAGGDSTSPGDDVDGSVLGGGNAPPIAEADVNDDLTHVFEVVADQLSMLDVISNDIEFDRTDFLKLTDVMPLSAGVAISSELESVDGDENNSSGNITLSGLPVGVESSLSPGGADVTVSSDSLMVSYDPTESALLTALAVGETLTDVWAYTIQDFNEDTESAQSRGDDIDAKTKNIKKATSYFTVQVTGVNESPEANDDSVSTYENQAIRILADASLLSDTNFNYGDLASDYQEYDESGELVTLLPPVPTLAILANDDDVDNDDTNASLLLEAVHTSEVAANTLVSISELDATITLDIRADREETSILYDPRSSEILNALSKNETVVDTFYYSIVDSHGARGVAKISVTVTGVNDVPTATDDSGIITDEDIELTILAADLLSNDTDPDQNDSGQEDDPTILLPFPSVSESGAALLFDGTNISYDPRTIDNYDELARNETLIDSFVYTISDSNGGQSSATVYITVEGRNDSPQANDDFLAVDENSLTNVSFSDGLLDNDVEIDINGSTPDDQPWILAQRQLSSALGATLNINPDGSFSYDANSSLIDSLKEGEKVQEVFPYIIVDNSRTQAVDDTYKLLSDSVSVSLEVLANDAVVGSAPLSISSFTVDPENAQLVIIESADHGLQDGLLIKIDSYVGEGSYNGVHAITVIDRDHFSIESAYTDDPVGSRGQWTPWFNISLVSDGSMGGDLVIVDGQQIEYTPPVGFYGTESFSYTIEDGVGGQDVAEVELLVIDPQVNGLLSASNDTFRIGMGESEVVVDVLANDSILPALGSDLTITLVDPVASATGTVELVDGGKLLKYTPDDLSTEIEESFTYTVLGNGSLTAQATVTFQVEDRSDLLQGADDAFFVIYGSADNVLDVLANDSSLPTYPVSSEVVAVNGEADSAVSSSGGTVSLIDGEVLYTPPSSILTDTFTYTSRDLSGSTTTQTVKVRIVPVDQDFYASDDHYIVKAGSDKVTLPVLINDAAVDNDTAVIEIVNFGLNTDLPPNVERVAIVGGTSIEYTPPASATTEDFNYEISIGTLDRREAKITITVVDSFTDLADPQDDFYHVEKNASAQILDVLLNDIPYPAAGWTWSVSSINNFSDGGSAELVGDGTAISYTPALGFFGVETFEYTIVDEFGDSETAQVTVTVGEQHTAPDEFVVLQDSLNNSINVLLNDDLLEAYATDYTIATVSSPSAGGSVSVIGTAPNNYIQYIPLAGYVGEETFTYEVSDRSGGVLAEQVSINVLPADGDRDVAELTVEITGVNDVPVVGSVVDGAINDKETVAPFAGITLSDVDEAGLQLQTATINFDSSYGTATAALMSKISAGSYTVTGTPSQVANALAGFVFDPFENHIDYVSPGSAGVDFNLSITDGYIPSPINLVSTIIVTPVNDGPTVAQAIANQVVQLGAATRAIYLPDYFADVDDDVYTDDLFWSVVSTSNASIFDSVETDNNKSLLVLDFSSDNAGQSSITVQGADRGQLVASITFSVTVEGPPVIQLANGQTQPEAGYQISYSPISKRREYRQSFRVTNEGSLPVDSFIVRVTALNNNFSSITLDRATFSSSENGTRSNFLDDTHSSAGVTLKEVTKYQAYDVNYNYRLNASESVVVHLTYKLVSSSSISVRPNIEIVLSPRKHTVTEGEVQINKMSTGDYQLTLNLQAGKQYKLQYSNDLKSWSDWLTRIPVSTVSHQLILVDDGYNTNSHPSNDSARFYRLVD